MKRNSYYLFLGALIGVVALSLEMLLLLVIETKQSIFMYIIILVLVMILLIGYMIGWENYLLKDAN